MDERSLTKIVRNMTLYKNSISKRDSILNNTEYEMLRYITKRDYRSFVEVADYLNVDKALITRMSKKLLALGYIKIEADKNDFRKKLLIATEEALRLKGNVENEEIYFYSKCLEVLSDSERDEFLRLADRVYLESKRFRKNGWNFDEKK